MAEENASESFLEVGVVAVLATNADPKTAQRFKTTVRGWTEGVCIIVDTPEASPFRRHQPCVVRFVTNGRACGFDTVVTDVAASPRPYLYLKWPSDVQIIRMRRHERLSTSLPCVVNLHSGERLRGTVRDISVGGCCFQAKVGINTDERVMLNVVLPHGYRIEDVACRLRNARKQGTEAMYGCEFENLCGVARDHIEFYVTTRLEQLRSGRLTCSHVLIADPDIERVWPLHEAVEEGGRNAFVANGVADLFYRLRFAPPAILVMSYEQHSASAEQLCRIIRKSAALDRLPILVYGGKGPDPGARLREAGADVHVGGLNDIAAVTAKINELAS